jgi:dihydrofolate reductase
MSESKESFPGMYIVVAMTEDRVIGNDNGIPWHIPEDLEHFKRLTTGGVVIMGRKTFQSIGRPLPDRHNLIVSKTLAEVDGAEVVPSLEAAIERASQFHKDIFFIGGREIYKKALDIAGFMYVSWIPGHAEGDTKFPPFDHTRWEPVDEKVHENFRLVLYRRREGRPLVGVEKN